MSHAVAARSRHIGIARSVNSDGLRLPVVWRKPCFTYTAGWSGWRRVQAMTLLAHIGGTFSIGRSRYCPGKHSKKDCSEKDERGQGKCRDQEPTFAEATAGRSGLSSLFFFMAVVTGVVLESRAAAMVVSQLKRINAHHRTHGKNTLRAGRDQMAEQNPDRLRQSQGCLVKGHA